MSFMTSLASIIKKPSKHKKEIRLVLITIGIALLLFTLINCGDIFRVFVIIVGALYLFTTEKLPIELTAFLIMVVLMIFNIVTPTEGVSGFSNSATITVMAMFILSAGIQKTGIIHILGRHIFSFAGNNELKQILAISMIVGPMSAFVNNTALVAIMLPMVLDLAKRSKIPSGRLLIPLSFVAMSGGTLTLIGNSTNILASSILESSGFPAIEMFEFTNLGIIMLLATIAFFVFFGRFLLPYSGAEKNNEENEIENDFLAEIIIEKGSKLIKKSLKKSGFLEKNELKVIKLIRGDNSFVKDCENMPLEEGDIVLIKADEQRIFDLDKNSKDGIKLLLDFDETKKRFPAGTGQIVKVVVRSSTMFHQKSLSAINFWKKFNATVVGIQRDDVSEKRLSNMPLKTGEIILIKTNKQTLTEIQNSNDFVVLETVEKEFNTEKMWTAMAIVIGVVIVSALRIMPIMVSSLTGVLLMIFANCLDFKSFRTNVNWNIIFVLAGVIPLGIALEKSGAAEEVAKIILFLANFLPPIFILGIFSLFTLFLTSIISNNASVILLIPIALSVAEKLELNPFSFVLAVIFASSMTFLTPVGYQTNAMIFSAGNYKFKDFFKVGAPLSIILVVISTLLIVKFWGL